MRTVSFLQTTRTKVKKKLLETAAALWFTRLDTPKLGRYHFRFRPQRGATPSVICLSRSRIN